MQVPFFLFNLDFFSVPDEVIHVACTRDNAYWNKFWSNEVVSGNLSHHKQQIVGLVNVLADFMSVICKSFLNHGCLIIVFTKIPNSTVKVEIGKQNAVAT